MVSLRVLKYKISFKPEVYHFGTGSEDVDLPEADVVEGFVIDAVGLVGVFNELMDGEGGVVWFDNGIRYLWRWDNREGVHDSVWVFFSDFRDKKCTHTGTSTTTERVSELESLKCSRLVIGNPIYYFTWRQSQDSASLRTTSSTESTSSAPSV